LFGSQYTEQETDELGEHTVLRYRTDGASGTWQSSQLEPGHVLRQPAPLFKKLEDSVAEEERARLGK
jgi:methionyl-tRNA synthetase